jgi:hypothetical protein
MVFLYGTIVYYILLTVFFGCLVSDENESSTEYRKLLYRQCRACRLDRLASGRYY